MSSSSSPASNHTPRQRSQKSTAISWRWTISNRTSHFGQTGAMARFLVAQSVGVCDKQFAMEREQCRVELIDWATWQPTERANLCFVIRGGQILLIRKKRGLGAGKI